MKPANLRILMLLMVPAVAAAAIAATMSAAAPRTAPVAVPPVPQREAKAAVVVRKPSFVYQQGPGVDLLIQADRQTIRQLRLAKEMAGRKDYLGAVGLLQRILDRDKDAFYYPDPEKRDVLASIRGAAERMIAGMPKAGRDAYLLKYGGAAKGLLDDAVKDGSVSRLREIVRRFFHTPAGYEATYRSGILHEDRGEHLAAALCFERLRQLPDAAKPWEPALSLRAAVCLSRAGLADRAKKALADFHKRNGNGAVRLAGKSVHGFTNLGDGPKWLAQNFVGAAPTDVRETEWALFRGNHRRNGIAPLTSKADRVTWRMTTVVDPTDPTADIREKSGTPDMRRLRQVLAAVSDANSKRGVPYPPAVHPLIVNDVVVFRTLEFTRAVELHTGSRLWESAPGLGLKSDLNVESRDHVASISRQIQATVKQRVLYDTNRGTMSSDGRLLYTIEESGPAFVSINTRNDDDPRVPATMPLRANRLAAYDLRSGKWVWEFGGVPYDAEPRQADDYYFLGAPLPIGPRLYCLAEVKNEIRLLALEQRVDGAGRNREVGVDLVWSQPLVGAGSSISQDWSRRTSAAMVSYADGVLVCNTDAGYLIGVNLTSQSLMWAYRYGTQRSRPFPGPFPRPVPVPQNQSGWFDHAPAISAGRVVVTPRGSDEIHCLNLADGSVAWKKPRGDGLYVAGIVDGRVIVVGRATVRALKRADGSDAWKASPRIAVPSGRGIIAGRRLFVPTRTDGIVLIDVTTGKRLGNTKLPGDRRPGNLVIAGGTMVSQGVNGVNVFPLPLAK